MVVELEEQNRENFKHTATLLHLCLLLTVWQFIVIFYWLSGISYRYWFTNRSFHANSLRILNFSQFMSWIFSERINVKFLINSWDFAKNKTLLQILFKLWPCAVCPSELNFIIIMIVSICIVLLIHWLFFTELVRNYSSAYDMNPHNFLVVFGTRTAVILMFSCVSSCINYCIYSLLHAFSVCCVIIMYRFVYSTPVHQQWKQSASPGQRQQTPATPPRLSGIWRVWRS